jgi:UDPglucose 6-dehydrogenase
METLGVVGVGKLGLCMTLALEGAGYNMICYEKNKELSKAISDKSLETIEPSVSELLKASKNITMVSSLQDIYKLPTIFVVVATPSLPNGSYNHSAVDEVVDSLLALNETSPNYDSKLLVISCTTMPTYCDSLQARVSQYNYKVCYNPEFIAQGDIVHGLKNPDMVLIGGSDDEASNKLMGIYKRFLENSPTFQVMSCTEAELTKISLNCFLTTKIAFANMIGDIVLKAGGNPQVVLKAIGSDTRVGGKFLKWGHGFGGPCLPRDNRALCFFSNTIGIDHIIGKTTDESNKRHLTQLFEYIQLKNIDKKPLLFNSIVYKEGTYILEESQKLELAILCANEGLSVYIHDQELIIEQLKEKFCDKFNYIVNLDEINIVNYLDINYIC